MNPTMNRRSFLGNTTLAGVSLAAGSVFAQNPAPGGKKTQSRADRLRRSWQTERQDALQLASGRRFLQSLSMDLSKCLQMDPHLLVGLVNTELRNHCDSLDDLVKTHDIDSLTLVEKLANADYTYRADQNQFR